MIKIQIDQYDLRSYKTKTKTITLTEEELATAIMADSIGYASPFHGMTHVKAYLKGEKTAHCERCMAVFQCNLEELIKSAANYWNRSTPKQRKKLKQFAQKWTQIEQKDHITSIGISLLYPTHGP